MKASWNLLGLVFGWSRARARPLGRAGFMSGLMGLVLTAGCGGGGGNSQTEPDPDPPHSTTLLEPAPVDDYAAHAASLVDGMVGAAAPGPAVKAVSEVLSAAGVAVSPGRDAGLAARLPTASWRVDPAIAFNLAAEARERATSGRLTLADLGRMWAEMDFPFAGTGTPGQQLLAFLRESLLSARAEPGAARGFVPLFIAGMGQRQSPAFDLADPAAQPENLRLTLLEIELLHAMFDRSFQLDAATTGTLQPIAQREQLRSVAPGFCDELKAFYGTVGSKFGNKGLSYLKGQLTASALRGIGMTESEIAQYGQHGRVFGSLSTALKVLKLVQIYAAGHAVLTVEGPNPVRRPAFNGARVLVPVKATAGVSDEDWQNYQRTNGSYAYQSVKSCLGALGAPLPLDLKDIADKAAKWRIEWDLISGSPKHAVIPLDANNFDASSAGSPYGMSLARAGQASATATLRVQLREESQMATLMPGPLRKADVRVKAKVITAEPPSPALLIQVINLMGTVSALLDLSMGWVQTMLPPTSTTEIHVEYHEAPTAIDATMSLAMTFDAPHLRGTPDAEVDRHTLSGAWSTRLAHSVWKVGEDEYDRYVGSGLFTYSGLSTRDRTDPSGCTVSHAYSSRDGMFEMQVGPTVTLGGTVLRDGPVVASLNGGQLGTATWPAEQKTVTTECKPRDPDVVALPWQSEIFVAAANAINLEDLQVYVVGGALPGLDLDRGRSQADGSVELQYTTPRTVTLVGAGNTLDTPIVSQNVRIVLRPSHAP